MLNTLRFEPTLSYLLGLGVAVPPSRFPRPRNVDSRPPTCSARAHDYTRPTAPRRATKHRAAPQASSEILLLWKDSDADNGTPGRQLTQDRPGDVLVNWR